MVVINKVKGSLISSFSSSYQALQITKNIFIKMLMKASISFSNKNLNDSQNKDLESMLVVC